jgi:GTP-binding protein LepA
VALPGFKEVKPMVFAGLFPVESSDYEDLRDALEKLRLNDAAFTYEPETSSALGFGFRCGFLGLLHMEIVQERLEREFNIDLITTAPTRVYRVTRRTASEELEIDNPAKLPDAGQDRRDREPDHQGDDPSRRQEYVGAIISCARTSRGVQKDMTTSSPDARAAHYDIPLAEIVSTSSTAEVASRAATRRSTTSVGYRPARPGQARHPGQRRARRRAVDHRPPRQAYDARRKLLREAAKELIPRQHVRRRDPGGDRRLAIIARETVKALRKDVTAKCYGGDISRKRKLLEKQKEGKKRMKQVGSRRDPAGGLPRRCSAR